MIPRQLPGEGTHVKTNGRIRGRESELVEGEALAVHMVREDRHLGRQGLDVRSSRDSHPDLPVQSLVGEAGPVTARGLDEIC
jgi:hypothetical protein